MFTWLGTQLTQLLATYVLGLVGRLGTALAPVALSAMTLWVFLYGWAVLRNEVAESVPSFVWRAFKMGLVLAIALQSATYISFIADNATALSSGVATTFLPANVPAGTVATPYALLDRFNDQASRQVSDIMAEAGITRLDLLLAGSIFSIGSVAFLCVAVFVVTLSTVLLTFVIGVGPIFVLCLAWRPSQRFFDSWLSMLLNAVVLSWFSFFALGLSTYIGNALFVAIANGGGFLGSTLNVLGESIRYCVLMLMMAILCFQAPSLASALTGGAAVHQGIQMIQNAVMVAGLRSSRYPSTSGASGAGALAGGVVRSGPGLAYRAGRTASTLSQSGRVAAYRVAALRGRA